MVLYKCPRCGFNSEYRTNIVAHIEKRKTPCPCKTGVDVSLVEFKEFILNGSFDSVYKFIAENTDLKRRNAELKQENETLGQELEKARSSLVNRAVYVSADTTNVFMNISLTPYNKPNLTDAEKYYNEAIKKIFLSVPTLIEKIHFNEKIPENHNIFLPNFRSKLTQVFNGEKWRTVDEGPLLEELIDSSERILAEWAEGDPAMMKYIEKYHDIRARDGEEVFIRDLKTKVKKVLYDNRGLAKAAKMKT